MSFMGFVIRWGSMGLGVALVVGSAQSMLSFKARDERATPMTPSEAMALAGGAAEAYIALDAPLDASTRVYESCLNRPALTTTDTNPIYTLDIESEDPPERLLGATVRVDHPLSPGRIECQVVVEDGSREKQVQSYRILSPLDGTDGYAWVLSPRFHSEQEGDAWHARASYTGALSTFDDIKINVTDITHDAQAIRAFARSELDYRIPSDATVILDTVGRGPGSAPVRSYAGVAGTDGTLIVATDSLDLPSGAISGMVSHAGPPGERSTAREVASLLGAPDPARAVVIDTTRSAAGENARDRFEMQAGLVGGTLLFAFGASTTLLKHVLKRARRRRLEGAMAAANPFAGGITPQQAMALGIPRPGAPAPHRIAPLPHEAAARMGGTGPHGVAYPSQPNPYQAARPSAAPGGPAPSPEDAALEAEMARWTSSPPAHRAA